MIYIKTKDFHFELPDHLIAQTPIDRRDHSRLLTLDKQTGEISHLHFFDLTKLLKQGDCLVLNNSRVLPARLIGQRLPSNAPAEIVLLTDHGANTWECIVRPGRKLRKGAKVSFGDGILLGEISEVLDNGNRLITFQYEGIFMEILDRLGRMPLPPYITKELSDSERYQTVYSRELGSAAAPTAGLHFTKELMQQIEQMGVSICYVTLHVGLGTFRPVKTEDILEHEMHSEYCTISQQTADIINQTKQNGGRVISVGTTSCRTIESFANDNGIVLSGSKWTNIFIYPGYQFKVLDALITNFHLPESTLLMLISALATKDNVLHAYEEAIKEEYRFFSFGDSMMIY